MRLSRFVTLVLFSCSAFAQNPVSADSVFVGSIVKLKAKNYSEAEAGFREVIEREPDRVRGYLGVTQVFMSQGKPSDALEFLRASSQSMPLRMDLRVALGDTAVRLENYDLAVTEFSAVLKQMSGPNTLEVPRGAPTGLLMRDSTTDIPLESLGILTLRDLTPKGEAGIHLRLAEVYRLQRDSRSSLSEWQKLNELLPRTGWVLANLGMEQEATGKTSEAMATYKDALAVAPNNAIVLNNVAYLLAETGGDLFEAQRYSRRAAALAPGSLDILDTQGWIALKQGYLDDAIGTFLRVVLRQPGKVEFRRHLAVALTQRGVHSPEIDELIKALNAPKASGDEAKILVLVEKTEKKP